MVGVLNQIELDCGGVLNQIVSEYDWVRNQTVSEYDWVWNQIVSQYGWGTEPDCIRVCWAVPNQMTDVLCINLLRDNATETSKC